MTIKNASHPHFIAITTLGKSFINRFFFFFYTDLLQFEVDAHSDAKPSDNICAWHLLQSLNMKEKDISLLFHYVLNLH